MDLIIAKLYIFSLTDVVLCNNFTKTRQKTLKTMNLRKLRQNYVNNNNFENHVGKPYKIIQKRSNS